jgi:hypothetical protein
VNFFTCADLGAVGITCRLRFICLLHLGHATVVAPSEHTNKQLQLHRIYFFPSGAFFNGVASLQVPHRITCCFKSHSYLFYKIHKLRREKIR